MYAIIKTGGKQYRVQPGDLLRIEKLNNDLGSEVELTNVLMIGDGDSSVNVGTPDLKDAKVTAVVTRHAKDRKVIIFKKKRRQGYRRYKTHRQPFTEIFVKSISFNGNKQETDSAPYIYGEGERRKIIASDEATTESSSSTTEVASKTTVEKTSKKKAAANKKKVSVKKKPYKKKANQKLSRRKKWRLRKRQLKNLQSKK